MWMAPTQLKYTRMPRRSQSPKGHLQKSSLVCLWNLRRSCKIYVFSDSWFYRMMPLLRSPLVLLTQGRQYMDQGPSINSKMRSGDRKDPEGMKVPDHIQV